MIRDWLKTIIGQAPMPENIAERAKMIEFADTHHVLGQMAVTWEGKTEGKLKEVLENGLLRTGFDHRMLRFEKDRITRALLGSGIAPILLKGGAYVAVGSKAAKGRRVSDIDIMVSEEQLDQTEGLLRAAGWEFDETTNNDYDIAYYRKYMHELPPLRHNKRQTVVDVHHRLLPRTSRIKLQSNLMLDAAMPLAGGKLKVLAPVDRFIHSAVHSFADGSFDTPARTLVELYYLLRDLSTEEQKSINVRARDVGAMQPVATALWILADVLDDTVADTLLKASNAKPSGLIVRYALKQKLMHINKAYSAKTILLIRSHYLRMPWHLLLAHLLRKAIRNVRTLLKRADQEDS